jgi:hypothetical protein
LRFDFFASKLEEEAEEEDEEDEDLSLDQL